MTASERVAQACAEIQRLHEVVVITAIAASAALVGQAPTFDQRVVAKDDAEAAFTRALAALEARCAELEKDNEVGHDIVQRWKRCLEIGNNLIKEKNALEAENQRLWDFAEWCLTESSFQGLDLDGGDAQDKAGALGIIVETKYDPARHGENNVGASPGDPWFEFARPTQGARTAQEKQDE